MESKQMQEMTRATVRDSAGVFFFFRSVQIQTLILSTPFYLAVCPLILASDCHWFFPDVDETNCIPDDGVSTSFLRCGTFVVIFTFDISTI